MKKYISLPSCPRYHDHCELGNRPGYYPNVSVDQLECVNDLIDLINEHKLNIHHDDEDDFLKLLRFLRARRFHVQNSFDFLKADIEWRQSPQYERIRKLSANDILGCEVENIFRFFPTWISGVDKQSRPISWRQFGKFEIWNVLKHTTMARLIEYHAWEGEEAVHYMYDLGKKTNRNIETFVVIVDAGGSGLKQMTSDAFSFIKGMSIIDSAHFPERLGMLVVINAPTVLSFAWKGCQSFLDEVTKSKIRIYGTNRDEWLPALMKVIDQDQIPRMYGGSAPDPDPQTLSQKASHLNEPLIQSELDDSSTHFESLREDYFACFDSCPEVESRPRTATVEAQAPPHIPRLALSPRPVENSWFTFFCLAPTCGIFEKEQEDFDYNIQPCVFIAPDISMEAKESILVGKEKNELHTARESDELSIISLCIPIPSPRNSLEVDVDLKLSKDDVIERFEATMTSPEFVPPQSCGCSCVIS